MSRKQQLTSTAKQPKSLAAKETKDMDAKTTALTQIQREVQMIAPLLREPWPIDESSTSALQQQQELLERDVDSLEATLSFIPGRLEQSCMISAKEASSTYKKQSAFGRKIDLRTRFACGRCARCFYSYPGGPNRVQSAAARKEVAGKSISFENFCRNVLGVDSSVVKAEVFFSLLCDVCPAFLPVLIKNRDKFHWSLFVDHCMQAFKMWQSQFARLPCPPPSHLALAAPAADHGSNDSNDNNSHQQQSVGAFFYIFCILVCHSCLVFFDSFLAFGLLGFP